MSQLDTRLATALDTLRGGLVVSCQAYPGEPMRDPRTTAQIAQSVVAGGAVAVRVQGPEDVRATRAVVDVPLIGLWKIGEDGVFITPTLESALEIAAAGADVVALDGTRRPRPDGRDLAGTVRELLARHEVLVMADCGSLDDALAAQDAGAHILGTTLAGYTGERPRTEGPDLELLEEIVAKTDLPVVIEGRIRTPAQVSDALARGAYAVCVGTAITHPTSITRWFAEATRPAHAAPTHAEPTYGAGGC